MKGVMMKKHQVVVVGAGPAGLTAAVTLARAHVDVLLVEKRRAGSALPRATVLSLRTMQLRRAVVAFVDGQPIDRITPRRVA
jgi:2-polyprenyl-6-methoxyphenol hydroxylase-like FAD-dependent oxidoreductase